MQHVEEWRIEIEKHMPSSDQKFWFTANKRQQTI